MRKPLKFSHQLCELVLSGAKDTTWRVDDDKNLQKGDELQLLTPEGKEFAKARVEWTKDTTFGELEESDLEGHEKFDSQEELLTTYSAYYKKRITHATKVKVIKFKLE